MSYSRIEPISTEGMELVTTFQWRDTKDVRHNDAMYYLDGNLYISRDGAACVETMTIDDYKDTYLGRTKLHKLNRIILDFINGREL